MTELTPALARAAEEFERLDDGHGLLYPEHAELVPEVTKRLVSAALDVDEMASLIWETSRHDEGTISATGAKHVAQVLRARLLGDA